MTFRDSLGNTWYVHRSRPNPMTGHDLVIIECERPMDLTHPSYAAIPVADLPTLLASLRIACAGGDTAGEDAR